jgi:hypothetical protein
MEDEELVARIGELVAEEHRLQASHQAEGLDDQARARLDQLERALDQCWDLLRQRRAKRAAGQDPETAALRPADVVEEYRQ